MVQDVAGSPLREAIVAGEACAAGDTDTCLDLAEAAAWTSACRAMLTPASDDPWQVSAAFWLEAACLGGAGEACLEWKLPPVQRAFAPLPRLPDTSKAPAVVPSRAVTVKVTADGRPAGGYTVRVVSTDLIGVTDQRGVVRFDLAGGRASVEVLDQGRYGQAWVDAAEGTAELRLVPAARHPLTVVGPDGAPVPGAVAEVLPRAALVHGPSRSTAGADGQLTLDLRPDDEEGPIEQEILVTSPDGAAFAWVKAPKSEIRLVPAPRLRLVDGAGTPLPQVSLDPTYRSLPLPLGMPANATTDAAGELPVWPGPSSSPVDFRVNGQRVEVTLPRSGVETVVVPWVWTFQGLPPAALAWVERSGERQVVFDGELVGTESGEAWVLWFASDHGLSGSKVLLPAQSGPVTVGSPAPTVSARLVDGCGAPLAGIDTSIGRTDAAGRLFFPEGLAPDVGFERREEVGVTDGAVIRWDPEAVSRTCGAARRALSRARRSVPDPGVRYELARTGWLVAAAGQFDPPWSAGWSPVRGAMGVAGSGSPRLAVAVDGDTAVVMGATVSPAGALSEVWIRE